MIFIFKMAPTEKCIKNIIDPVALIKSLGFTVHVEKSQFLPTQELDILGFTINSVNTSFIEEGEKRASCLPHKKHKIKKKKTSKFEWTLNNIRIEDIISAAIWATIFLALLDVRHCPQLQSCAISRKINKPNLKNDKKTSFGPDFGPLGPNLSHQ